MDHRYPTLLETAGTGISNALDSFILEAGQRRILMLCPKKYLYLQAQTIALRPHFL